jgi:hypothetical protein
VDATVALIIFVLVLNVACLDQLLLLLLKVGAVEADARVAVAIVMFVLLI